MPDGCLRRGGATTTAATETRVSEDDSTRLICRDESWVVTILEAPKDSSATAWAGAGLESAEIRVGHVVPVLPHAGRVFEQHVLKLGGVSLSKTDRDAFQVPGTGFASCPHYFPIDFLSRGWPR